MGCGNVDNLCFLLCTFLFHDHFTTTITSNKLDVLVILFAI